MLLGRKTAFCLAILWKAEITSPLLWVIFFLTLQNLLNSFPHKRFMGFISFSFDRRSGLIKGGVRLLTCCVKMTGTQLPNRTQSGREVYVSLDFRVQCVVSASSDLDPLFTDTYLLLCIAQALGQFFPTDYHLILTTTP